METFIKRNEKRQLEVQIKRTYQDGIKRDLINLNDVLKDYKYESPKKLLCGYRFVRNTLMEVNEAIAIYLEMSAEERLEMRGRALFSYIVIQYGKCFKPSKGWGVMLQQREVFKRDEVKIKSHDWFIGERDTYIAHGGKTESQFVTLIVEKRKANNQIDNIFVHSLSGVVPEPHALTDLKKLIEEALDYVEKKNFETERIIYNLILENGYTLSSEILEMYKLISG